MYGIFYSTSFTSLLVGSFLLVNIVFASDNPGSLGLGLDGKMEPSSSKEKIVNLVDYVLLVFLYFSNITYSDEPTLVYFVRNLIWGFYKVRIPF